MTRPYALDAKGVDCDTLYSRCPQCDVVSPAASLTYTIGDGGDLDPVRPIETGCTPCQHKYVITYEQILPRDTEVTCIAGPGFNRPEACGNVFPVPAAADQVCCPQCRVYQSGPAALSDPSRAGLLRDAEKQFGAYARAVVTEANHQAGESS